MLGAINEVPFNGIAAAMYASLAAKATAGQKEIPNQGTATDIDIVSTLLPYCDAMFVDNKCRAILRDIPRDFALPYTCKVFSPNTGVDFIQYLTETRDSVRPDHLKLIEEVYGPAPMKPPSGIYGQDSVVGNGQTKMHSLNFDQGSGERKNRELRPQCQRCRRERRPSGPDNWGRYS
jgi:hypothetical protein